MVAMADDQNNIIKLKKNPQAPKRFKSAYMFYSSMKHKQFRKDPQHRKVSHAKRHPFAQHMRCVDALMRRYADFAIPWEWLC
jgi:hypothetical protein